MQVHRPTAALLGINPLLVTWRHATIHFEVKNIPRRGGLVISDHHQVANALKAFRTLENSLLL